MADSSSYRYGGLYSPLFYHKLHPKYNDGMKKKPGEMLKKPRKQAGCP